MAELDNKPVETNLHGCGEFNGVHEVSLLQSMIRSTCSLLESSEEYGHRSKTGQMLLDVDYILRDALDKLDKVFKLIDLLESRSFSHNATPTALTAQAGALAGVAALRNLERIAERTKNRGQDGDELSMEEWWQIKDSASVALQVAAGPQNAFMAGFLATISEYLMVCHEDCAQPLDNWNPEAAMSNTEKAASRAKFAEEVTASMA